MLQEKNKIRISVICPVLNVEKYISETIETVLSQTYKDWELLIMNGVSNDRTLEIVNSYAGKYTNIRVYSSKDECMWQAFEWGLNLAKGEFVCFLGGQDGYSDKDWFSKCIEVFDKNKDVSLTWGLCHARDVSGNLVGTNESYTNFIETRNRFDAFLIGVKKFLKILKDLLLGSFKRKKVLLEKIFSRTASLRVNAFIQTGFNGRFPQKEDWFLYWLKTGLCFPDQGMLVVKNVLLDCTTKYEKTRNQDELNDFLFNFNARGYLAYYVPTFVVLGNLHEDSGSSRRVLENL